MISDLNETDIERILLIHHVIMITLTFALSILWAKVSVLKKHIEQLKKDNKSDS
jgi:ribosomal protein S15P/S13E